MTFPTRDDLPKVTHEQVRELLHYDPETGKFTWLPKKGSKRTVMDADYVFPKGDGYARVEISGRLYLSHRLAWLYVHGHWPEQHIDHINGDKLDNRLANLRDIPLALNIVHRPNIYRNNTSGYPGVVKSGRGWRAEMRLRGKKQHLGTFSTKEEAHEAYKAAKAAAWESFT